MANSETLTIELPAETAGLLREAVRTGEYGSAAEAVDAASRGWDAQRDVLGYSADDIHRLADEGIASGPGRDLTLEELEREALSGSFA